MGLALIVPAFFLCAVVVFLEGFFTLLCVSQIAFLTFLVSLLFPGSYFCCLHVCAAWDSSLNTYSELSSKRRKTTFPRSSSWENLPQTKGLWFLYIFSSSKYAESIHVFCYLSHKLFPCSFLFPLPNQWNKFLENRGHVSFTFAGPAFSTVHMQVRAHYVFIEWMNDWMYKWRN